MGKAVAGKRSIREIGAEPFSGALKARKNPALGQGRRDGRTTLALFQSARLGPNRIAIEIPGLRPLPAALPWAEMSSALGALEACDKAWLGTMTISC